MAQSSPPPSHPSSAARSRRPRSPSSPGILRALGVFGWDHLEPVVLAALATESPLLLIGPHGSAKTLVLTRLAEALGLVQRHYNASLLNFDDLIGFPVPEGGKLVYLETPATIWPAEAVFFDEVSRCRPDLQNKLFPIVHERRVQGIALDRLRHRWAAMNPAPRVEPGERDDFEYAGAEPLDVALADRFAFVVEVPDLKALSAVDQRATLVRHASVDLAAVGAALTSLLDAVRAKLSSPDAGSHAVVAEYVQTAAQKLAQTRHPISTRRAVQLARNIEAVTAVLQARADTAAPEDSFYLALRHSLPDAAWGRPVDGTALLAVHRAAWEIARLKHGTLKDLLREPDAVRRLALAIRADALSPTERGEIVSDSYASLDRISRLATAAVTMQQLADHAELPASTLEPIAADYASFAGDTDVSVTVQRGGADWKRQILGSWLAGLDLGTTRGKSLGNIAAVLLRDDDPFEPARLEQAYDHAASCVSPPSADAQPRKKTRRKKVA